MVSSVSDSCHCRLAKQDYHIRKYRASDHAAVVRLFIAGMREYESHEPRAAWDVYIARSLQDDIANIESVYDIEINARTPRIGCFWVADRDTILIGMIAVQSLKSEPGVAELRRLSVSKDSRRTGLAGRLVRTLEDWCQAHQFHRIVLSTRESMRPACLLYESLGYTFFRRETLRLEQNQDGDAIVSVKPGEDAGLAITNPTKFRVVYYQKNLTPDSSKDSSDEKLIVESH